MLGVSLIVTSVPMTGFAAADNTEIITETDAYSGELPENTGEATAPDASGNEDAVNVEDAVLTESPAETGITDDVAANDAITADAFADAGITDDPTAKDEISDAEAAEADSVESDLSALPEDLSANSSKYFNRHIPGATIVPGTTVSLNDEGNIFGAVYNVTSSTEYWLYIWPEGAGTSITKKAVDGTGSPLASYKTTIKNILIEDGITAIDTADAFNGFTGVHTVYFPSGFDTIGDRAFYNCTSLANVKFDANRLYSIGASAFYNCAFSTFNMPSPSASNSYIGPNAFESCKNLARITIPSGVRKIDSYAFTGCTKLRRVELPTTLQNIGVSIFDTSFTEKDGDKGTVYFYGLESQWDAIGINSGNEHWNPSRVRIGSKVSVTGISIDNDYYFRYYEDMSGIETVRVNVTLSPKNATYRDIVISSKSISGSCIRWISDTKEADDDGKCSVDIEIQKQVGEAEVRFTAEETGATVTCRVIVKKRDIVDAPLLDNVKGGETQTKALAVTLADNEKHTLASSTPETQVFYSVVSAYSSTTSSGWGRTGLFETDAAGYFHVASAYRDKVFEVTDMVTGSEIYQKYYASLSEVNKKKTKPPATFYMYAVSIPIGGSLASRSPVAFFKVTYTETIPDPYGEIEAADRTYFDDQSDGVYNPKGVWIPLSIRESENLVYTGDPVTIPDLRVYYATDKLKAGVDYTVTYAKNINASYRGVENAPVITVKLSGNYSGSKNFNFRIRPKSIAAGTFEPFTLAQSDRPQSPDPHVILDDVSLVINQDYTVMYRPHMEDDSAAFSRVIPAGALGFYDVKVTGTDNFTGSFTVNNGIRVVSNAININDVTVSKIPIQQITDPGYGVTLDPTDMPTITYLKEKVPSTAYTIAYEQNVTAGTGYLKVIATGNSYTIGSGDDAIKVSFVGTKYVPFTIKGIPMSKINVFDKNDREFTNAYMMTYTGDEVMPRAYLSYKERGYNLTEGKDYTIVYSNNVKAGKAKISMTGRGIFTGTTTRTFTISKATLDSCSIDVVKEYDFSSKGVKPDVTISLNGVLLAENVDYVLSYPKKAKTGTYTLTIRPKGSLGGTKKTYQYRINSISIEDCTVITEDKVYSPKSGAHVQKPVIYDTNGVKLKARTDYDTQYEYNYASDVPGVIRGGRTLTVTKGSQVLKTDIIPAGSAISITVTGKGNYAGDGTAPSKVSAVYRITKNKISSLKFNVEGDYVHTGSRILPGKDDISVTGTSVMDTGRLYTITGYGENIKAGTGTITIRGLGDYGGTMTLKFKIKAK